MAKVNLTIDILSFRNEYVSDSVSTVLCQYVPNTFHTIYDVFHIITLIGTGIQSDNISDLLSEDVLVCLVHVSIGCHHRVLVPLVLLPTLGASRF